MNRLRGQVESLTQIATSAEDAWNSTQLRHGHRAAGSGGGGDAKHKSQFCIHGTLKLGYTDGIDARLQTNNYVDIRAAMVDCCMKPTKAKAMEHTKQSSSGYMLIERSFDDTPSHQAFGQLAEIVAPSARYILPRRHRQLAGKSLASYKELMKLGIPKAQHGILDILSESIVIDVDVGEYWQLLIPPLILLGKSSGHVFRALETALDGMFSQGALMQLDKDIVFVIDNADSASGNRKAMLLFGKTMDDNILYWANRCIVHQVHRCVIVVLENWRSCGPCMPSRTHCA